MATISQLKRVAKKRVMVAQHQENDGQREIVVVYRALFSDLAPSKDRASFPRHRGDDFLLIRNDNDETFATMMVPINAPICVNAPRPLNTCVKA